MNAFTARRASGEKASVPMSCRRAFQLVPLCLLLSACDHRVASHKAIDVCTLALDPVSKMLQEVPATNGLMQPPNAGSCTFTADSGDGAPRRVTVAVLTSASISPDDLGQTTAIVLAEAEQTYGDPGTSEFADVAKLAVTFNSPAGVARQVLIGERGVLMEIGLEPNGFAPEQVADLVNEIWRRILAHEPPAR